MTSAQHQRDITIRQLKGSEWGVYTMSVVNSEIVVGTQWGRELYVYSTDGSHVTTIALPDSDTLCYVTWTPRGHIVYTAYNCRRVVVMSRSGDVIAHTQMTGPLCLSVSTDDVICLADRKSGVYQSRDDGVTWSHVFKSPDGWQCWQVIRVSRDRHTDDWWTLEYKDMDTRLRVYTTGDRGQTGGHVTWRDVTVPSQAHITGNSRLAYDGHTNIFLNDSYNRAIHVLSTVSGQYDRQLVSPSHFTSYNRPECVAVDSQRDGHVTMYVGQWYGLVSVFRLSYEH